MALINCPECNKEISNKSKVCVYCGYPINNQSTCLINGIEYDISFLLDENIEYMDKLVRFVQLTDCYFGDSSDEIDKIIKNKTIPQSLNIKSNKQFKEEQNQIKCITCGSTNIKKISATSKVVGATMFGLFSKTARSQFKCESCGYKW